METALNGKGSDGDVNVSVGNGANRGDFFGFYLSALYGAGWAGGRLALLSL